MYICIVYVCMYVCIYKAEMVTMMTAVRKHDFEAAQCMHIRMCACVCA